MSAEFNFDKNYMISRRTLDPETECYPSTIGRIIRGTTWANDKTFMEPHK